MGEKEAFPGFPRDSGDARDFRERQVIGAAAATQTIDEELEREVDFRTFDPGETPEDWANQFARILERDIGRPMRKAEFVDFQNELDGLSEG